MMKAFDAWNDMKFGPLDGSQHFLSIGTPVPLPPPIHTNIVDRYNDIIRILTNVEPWRADDYQKFKGQAFLDRMNLMSKHLAQSAKYAQKAITTASSTEYIDLCGYEGMNGRPTCREYAELNYGPIAIADAICRQRCHMLRSYHLLVEINASRLAGDNESADMNEKLHLDLIREDIGVQERFCELLRDFAVKRPCYTRTSLTEQEISDLLRTTEIKIEAARSFLIEGFCTS
jgi:hypothetical protein